MNKYIFTACASDAEIRIDKFLFQNIKEHSREEIKKNIDKGNLYINGDVGKPSYKLITNDKVEFYIRNEWRGESASEDIKLDIIFEDKDILVINKPQGMPVHPSSGHRNGTLLNAVLYYLNTTQPSAKPGIVHRIDMDTSGVVVVAKNKETHNFLAKQFEGHTINRKYEAIVHGVLVENEGKVVGPIARDAIETKKRVIDFDKGKEAVTYYKVIERFDMFTLIECTIDTGRTHQIRVHMSQIGHPILGDEMYGEKDQLYKLKGQALHAKLLGFIHPSTNKYMEFNAEVPKYFKDVLKII